MLIYNLSFGILSVPVCYKIATMWSALEDQELSVALTEMFKSLAVTFGSLLFLSATSMKCVRVAKDDEAIDEECGNHLIPTKYIGSLLSVTWALSSWFGPLLKKAKSVTWGDLMVLNMGKMEALLFGLFGLASATGWVMFASLEEDRERLTDYIRWLGRIFNAFFYSLIVTLIFNIFVKSRLCPSSTSSLSGGGAFAMSQMHGSTFSGG